MISLAMSKEKGLINSTTIERLQTKKGEVEMGNKNQNTFKVLCPFCGEPYTAKMIHELEEIDAGCPTCGYGEEAVINVKIICEHCNRVVYQKETTVK